MNKRRIAYCECLKGSIFIVFIFISLSSCRKTFSSDQVVDDKLVVLAEITAGDSVKIPVGKTIRVGGGNLIRFEKVHDASVKLIEENTRTWMLQPNWGMQFSANPTTVFTNRKHFRSNTTYSIEIRHPSLGLAVGETHIPAQIRNFSMDTASDVFQGKPVLAVSIGWQDPSDMQGFYIIEAVKELLNPSHYFYYRGSKIDYDSPSGYQLYNQINTLPPLYCDTVSKDKFTRLNVYTQDANSVNSSIDNINNPFRRIFFKDISFNGQLYTTKVYVDRQFFKASDHDQRGRVRIQLKSVSKELFDYLLTYEKYKTDFGSIPNYQLVSPVGNIKNGLGIFGGSSRKEHIFYFDSLR